MMVMMRAGRGTSPAPSQPATRALPGMWRAGAGAAQASNTSTRRALSQNCGGRERGWEEGRYQETGVASVGRPATAASISRWCIREWCPELAPFACDDWIGCTVVIHSLDRWMGGVGGRGLTRAANGVAEAWCTVKVV